MNWIELHLPTSPDNIDEVGNILHVGVMPEIELNDSSISDIPFLENPVVTSYYVGGKETELQVRDIQKKLWHIQAFNDQAIGFLDIRETEGTDWAQFWKAHFHSLKFGNVVIKPSWREWDAESGEIVIELDPSAAFGTGLHPTTQLMLKALQGRIQANMSILDLGSGSGILSLVAGKMGAHVIGVEPSKISVELAGASRSANKLENMIEFHTGTIDFVGNRQFDLVFANITAGVLIDISQKLEQVLKPGCEVLTSGITRDRVDDVKKALKDAGLKIVETDSIAGWSMIAAKRREN